jgi:transcriptional regulator with XRE-family HTH domain
VHLGENIKRLRKKKGWSQADLAKEIGCHFSHIARIETGKYVPSLNTVIQIAEIFEVPIDYLVNSTEGCLEEIKIENTIFAERIRLLNNLNLEDQEVVTKVIDAMLTKKKMLDLLTNKQEPVNHL